MGKVLWTIAAVIIFAAFLESLNQGMLAVTGILFFRFVFPGWFLFG